jgi:hypothetical protein
MAAVKLQLKHNPQAPVFPAGAAWFETGSIRPIFSEVNNSM